MATSTLSRVAKALLAPPSPSAPPSASPPRPASRRRLELLRPVGQHHPERLHPLQQHLGLRRRQQCVWANSGTNWGVWANHPGTGGIKSYPNAKKVINKPITSLTSLTSSYNVTVPASGAYNTSYDIWDTDYDYEIMLWVNRTGAVGPLPAPHRAR